MNKEIDKAKERIEMLIHLLEQIHTGNYTDLMLDLHDELEVFAEFALREDPGQELHVVDVWIMYRESNHTPRVPSIKLKVRVYESVGYACTKCGSKDNLHIDHIVPYSKGGKTVFENLTVLCSKCNLSKKAQLD